jgi:hypothetical protein
MDQKQKGRPTLKLLDSLLQEKITEQYQELKIKKEAS